ncbi:hypothetical protein APUTEX25_000261 [Auxenochlorella protothecoides]|uniref:Uncharacterized protein n=1 Tax=Auxenochlorella protothecoides TaxID=3075 RepID=A0A3M7KYS1_AUXPR|nr:hypothetical protein APUTEX25_000261 [Auxenochlorella protothecoides]|eukprot:RMZ55678.1 hypothetical protein APUTEX25_000261 [Auxenochlorella protothecoides]
MVGLPEQEDSPSEASGSISGAGSRREGDLALGPVNHSVREAARLSAGLLGQPVPETRVARLPKAQLKARLAKGSEVPLELILEVKELLDATPRAE